MANLIQALRDHLHQHGRNKKGEIPEAQRLVMPVVVDGEEKPVNITLTVYQSSNVDWEKLLSGSSKQLIRVGFAAKYMNRTITINGIDLYVKPRGQYETAAKLGAILGLQTVKTTDNGKVPVGASK